MELQSMDGRVSAWAVATAVTPAGPKNTGDGRERGRRRGNEGRGNGRGRLFAALIVDVGIDDADLALAQALDENEVVEAHANVLLQAVVRDDHRALSI